MKKIEITLGDALLAVMFLVIGFLFGSSAMESDIQARAIQMGNARYEKNRMGGINFVWIDHSQTVAEEDKP